MADPSDPTLVIRRVEALVMAAAVNAANSSGDSATAAADLMCAFVLLSMRCGGSPDVDVEKMKPHAIVACMDFWGPKGRKMDA